MASQPLPIKAPVARGSSTPISPKPEATNDLFYWDQDEKKMKKLAAPSAEGLWFLAVKDGVMQWFPGATDCAPPAP